MAFGAAKIYGGTPKRGDFFVLTHTMTDGAAGTSYDQVIALPFDCVLVSCYATVETTLAAAATNYITLSVGDGTNDTMYGDTDSAGDNAAFTADTPRALAHYDGDHNLAVAGSAIHFKKVASGTPANAVGQIDFVLLVQRV